MRKFLVLAMVSTAFTTVEPVVLSQPAEARGLFDTLFPRAAERRRQRQIRRQRAFERERQRIRRIERAERKRLRKTRQRRVAKAPKITKPIFKAYSATPMRAVQFVALTSAFDKREHEIMTAEALERSRELLENRKTPAIRDVHPGGGSEPPEPTVRDIGVTDEASLVRPLLVSSAITGEVAQEPAMRLSAGAQHLKSISLRARTALGKAVIDHYKAAPEFLWIDSEGQFSERANGIIAALQNAGDYALNTDDYLDGLDSDGDGDALKAAMEREFSLTVAALRYIADARNGLVNPNRISTYHDFKGLGTPFGEQLSQLARLDRPETLLEAAHPRNAAFDRLRDELADLRIEVQKNDVVAVKTGTFVKPGATTDQMINIVEGIRRKASPEMLEKHAAVLSADHSAGLYTPELVALVRDFQKANGLGPDGIIGKRTLAKLQGDNPAVRAQKVRMAMERLRWHPDSLGSTRVFINQPAYRATYYYNDEPKLSMRTVVGKPQHQTNFFHDTIKYVEFNPYWGVPKSILVNEMLPKLRQNPGYLDNLGYEITDGRGRRISGWNVNWWGVDERFPFDVRQPPGRKNALGELKIMFPNKHSIYMHDTPAKSLFERDKRAFSHGCVRLQDPRAMAAAVLGTTKQRVGSYIADGANKRRKVKRNIPVYVSYFTAWPDDAGKVRYYVDIYGRDRALAKAMSIERKARERTRGA